MCFQNEGHVVAQFIEQGSIPYGVTGILHWNTPSNCIMALGLTEPLTEISTRNTSWRVKVTGV